ESEEKHSGEKNVGSRREKSGGRNGFGCMRCLSLRSGASCPEKGGSEAERSSARRARDRGAQREDDAPACEAAACAPQEIYAALYDLVVDLDAFGNWEEEFGGCVSFFGEDDVPRRLCRDDGRDQLEAKEFGKALIPGAFFDAEVVAAAADVLAPLALASPPDSGGASHGQGLLLVWTMADLLPAILQHLILIPEDRVRFFANWLRVQANGSGLTKERLEAHLRAVVLYSEDSLAGTAREVFSESGNGQVPGLASDREARGKAENGRQRGDEEMALLQILQRERDENFIRQQADLLWALLGIQEDTPEKTIAELISCVLCLDRSREDALLLLAEADPSGFVSSSFDSLLPISLPFSAERTSVASDGSSLLATSLSSLSPLLLQQLRLLRLQQELLSQVECFPPSQQRFNLFLPFDTAQYAHGLVFFVLGAPVMSPAPPPGASGGLTLGGAPGPPFFSGYPGSFFAEKSGMFAFSRDALQGAGSLAHGDAPPPAGARHPRSHPVGLTSKNASQQALVSWRRAQQMREVLASGGRYDALLEEVRMQGIGEEEDGDRGRGGERDERRREAGGHHEKRRRTLSVTGVELAVECIGKRLLLLAQNPKSRFLFSDDALKGPHFLSGAVGAANSTSFSREFGGVDAKAQASGLASDATGGSLFVSKHDMHPHPSLSFPPPSAVAGALGPLGPHDPGHPGGTGEATLRNSRVHVHPQASHAPHVSGAGAGGEKEGKGAPGAAGVSAGLGAPGGLEGRDEGRGRDGRAFANVSRVRSVSGGEERKQAAMEMWRRMGASVKHLFQDAPKWSNQPAVLLCVVQPHSERSGAGKTESGSKQRHEERRHAFLAAAAYELRMRLRRSAVTCEIRWISLAERQRMKRPVRRPAGNATSRPSSGASAPQALASRDLLQWLVFLSSSSLSLPSTSVCSPSLCASSPPLPGAPASALSLSSLAPSATEKGEVSPSASETTVSAEDEQPEEDARQTTAKREREKLFAMLDEAVAATDGTAFATTRDLHEDEATAVQRENKANVHELNIHIEHLYGEETSQVLTSVNDAVAFLAAAVGGPKAS
ncbi:eIF2 kinase IF2K-C, partial [Toxoplasma gondii ARI]